MNQTDTRCPSSEKEIKIEAEVNNGRNSSGLHEASFLGPIALPCEGFIIEEPKLVFKRCCCRFHASC